MPQFPGNSRTEIAHHVSVEVEERFPIPHTMRGKEGLKYLWTRRSGRRSPSLGYLTVLPEDFVSKVLVALIILHSHIIPITERLSRHC
jgi:hypothetical protein